MVLAGRWERGPGRPVAREVLEFQYIGSGGALGIFGLQKRQAKLGKKGSEWPQNGPFSDEFWRTEIFGGAQGIQGGPRGFGEALGAGISV